MFSLFARSKSAIWLALPLILIINVSLLAAQEHTENCFPAIPDWGSSPEQLAASKGQPQEKVDQPGLLTIYTYPADIFGDQGESHYYFDSSGLNLVLYTFKVSNEIETIEMFNRLESTLNCRFQMPGAGFAGTGVNEVKVMLTIWDGSRTMTYLSSFSTFPEISIKIMDKESPFNRAAIGAFQQMRDSSAKK